jgi:hypothetical protein
VETHDQIRQRFVDELVSGLMEEHDAGGGMWASCIEFVHS